MRLAGVQILTGQRGRGQTKPEAVLLRLNQVE